MDSIAIQGGAQLFGDIPVSGAKNSAIKLMAASILTDQPLLLTNMPRLADTRFLGQLLRQFGITVTEREGADGQESLFHAKDLTSTFAPYDLVRQMRPRSMCWGRFWRAPAMPRSRCPGAARSARGRWICTFRR